MGIEEKAKAYDEALERAKEQIKECGDNEGGKKMIQSIFPQLRESEDERIRKRAIAILKQQRDYWSYDGPMDKCPPLTQRQDLVDAVNAALSYLEKQKGQKPNYCYHEVDETGWTEEYRKAYYDGWNNCNMQHEQLKADQKPAEWSEEDEKMFASISDLLWEGYCCFKVNKMPAPEWRKIRSWLKSHRPSWKPSEEHLSALLAIFNDPDNIGSQTCQLALSDLYEQLKKL